MRKNIFHEKYGPWAIVIGSAEGLGASYATELARMGLNIVMLDIKTKALIKLSKQIRTEFDVFTEELHVDIRDSSLVEKVSKTIEKIDCGLVIYNAAISFIKPFISHSEAELNNLMEININQQLRIAHLFSRYLIKRNRNGGILLMSSLSGLIGMQLITPYAASKAFTWNLAEGLSHELKVQNIDVMACIAGATSTPTYLDTKPSYGFFKPKVMTSKNVVKASLKKLGKKTLFIPGFSNRLNYFILLKLLPRSVASKIANKMMAKMYAHRNIT